MPSIICQTWSQIVPSYKAECRMKVFGTELLHDKFILYDDQVNKAKTFLLQLTDARKWAVNISEWEVLVINYVLFHNYYLGLVYH